MITRDDLKKEAVEALKSGDNLKKECLQVVLSNVRNEEIRIGHHLDSGEIVGVLRKEIKQLNDHIDVYSYRYKIEYLNQFIPELMSKEEIRKVVDDTCSGLKTKGIIMRTIMPILKGRANNKDISEVVDEFIGE